MSTSRRLIRIATAAALAAVALSMGIQSASAGDERAGAAVKRHCIGNDHGAYVCFQPFGDKVLVKDTTENGFSAAAYWETDYGRKDVCLNRRGKGTVKVCNYNMREDRKIRFLAVDVDSPTNSYRNWSQHRRATI